MSYQIGMDAINCKAPARLAHTEYCSNDPLRRAIIQKCGRGLEEEFECDFIWTVNDGPFNLTGRGRVTDMGHAEFMEGGVDKRQPKECPFKTVEEVWAFDAIREYGLPDFDELVKSYENWYQTGQQANPTQVHPGGYYNTIVSGAIRSFGWDMLLEAAANRKKFEKVLDAIFRYSLHFYRAQAKTSIKAFICHDDMVWSEGPFMHPDIYRKVIFPRYAELWKPLRQAGIKLLFCSDAKYTMFIDDLLAAGADGLIFEPMTDLDTVIAACGKTHCIVGSKLDCRTLTFGTKADIKREIDATLKVAKACPGFIFAVGNHIPSNVPVENGLYYLEYLREHWHRR